jgi:SCP-2 sterol transfer family
MARYLSPEWVDTFNAALATVNLTEAMAVAGEGSLAASDGRVVVEQVISDVPSEGAGQPETVRTVLVIAEGSASLVRNPTEHVRPHVSILLGYPDALAMARGLLDPADALAAGRVRVRGELAVLVAVQSVLAAAAQELGTSLESLTDPN